MLAIAIGILPFPVQEQIWSSPEKEEAKVLCWSSVQLALVGLSSKVGERMQMNWAHP